MKPLSFDSDTAREIVGDEFSRVIEKKAREDADSEHFDPPKDGGRTYWGGVQSQMRQLVYLEQYKKRIARNERKRKDS